MVAPDDQAGHLALSEPDCVQLSACRGSRKWLSTCWMWTLGERYGRTHEYSWHTRRAPNPPRPLPLKWRQKLELHLLLELLAPRATTPLRIEIHRLISLPMRPSRLARSVPYAELHARPHPSHHQRRQRPQPRPHRHTYHHPHRTQHLLLKSHLLRHPLFPSFITTMATHNRSRICQLPLLPAPLLGSS